MEGARLEVGLLENHGTLVLRLDPIAVMPFLVSEGVVNLDEKHDIESLFTDGEKTDRLLTVVHRKAMADKSVFTRFLNALGDESLSGGQDLGKLVAKIYEDSSDSVVRARHQKHDGKLSRDQKAALRSQQELIVSSVDANNILADLVSCGVLTLDENEVIRSGSTYTMRARRLVQIIYNKSSQQFVHFVNILVSNESYAKLGTKLLKEGSEVVTRVEEIENDDEYAMEVLKRGDVPPRHSVYVDRPEPIERICSKLRQLKGTDGWVVVHGMAGFGKTILAAEALRNASLLREIFPDGVHWLSVGQMVTKDGDIDKAKLLTRLQNLIVRLDDQTPRPPNLESATNTLRKILHDEFPRSLLVLDDIWSPEVALAFSVRCCTMVTSRNSSVASMVHTPKVLPVEIAEGFSLDEGKHLLAQWLQRKPSQLPKDADTIIECCRGSPMVIALIGAILKKNPTNERKWNIIAEKLKKKHFHSIKLHAQVNEWSYQHATLNASIELSVENLPSHLQELFEMFVVFDYNTLVSSRALETMWNRDIIETEELVMELVGLSLVQRATPSDANTEYITIVVHDIVLDYLQQHISREKQVGYNSMIVKRYSECEGAFAELSDDDYVYQKLIGHIAAAGDCNLLGNLLSQLSWLIASARTGNAMCLLADYRLYKAKIPQKFESEVQQFEFFISGNMDILAKNPSKDDIIQQALLQPNASEVYIQASAKIYSDRKKSWFNWRNKEADPEKYVLKLKVHQEGVKKCQYSKDGSKVVSCSNDSSIKLWDASTGMELADFRGHGDKVTCCALSTSGRFVVSSSEDNTVRVWDTHRKSSIAPGNERVKKSQLMVEFKGHHYGVQCCAIAPNESVVLSGDIDSCVMLWEPATGNILSRWRLNTPSPMVSPLGMENQPLFPPLNLPQRSSSSFGTEGVLSCAFTPGGGIFVIATQTGSVLLFKTGGQYLTSLVGHKSQVRCCAFDQPGNLLATACLGDCSSKIWDVSTKECIHTLVHSCAVLSCDFSPDQERLVTGNTDGVVTVWLVDNGTLLQEYFLHSDHVNCVLYSPSQPHILSAADNGIVKIQWNDGRDLMLSPRSQSSNAKYHRRFSAQFNQQKSGFSALILCFNRKLKVLQLVQAPLGNAIVPAVPTLSLFTPRSWNLAGDGAHIVVGFEKGALQVLSVEERDGAFECKELWHVNQAHIDTIMKAFFSPDNLKLVTCSETQHKTWSVHTGNQLACIDGSGLGVKPVIFFQDSTKLASAQEKRILVWHAEDGTEKMICSGIVDSEESVVLCINLSDDNSRLIASNSAGLVMAWCMKTGETLLASDIPQRSPCARSCALSPSGSRAAAGFDDGSLKVWHVASLEKSKLIAHCTTNSFYWMIDVAFSPVGDKIVTLCDTIEWWSTTGKHLKTIRLKGSFGKYIRFSPDFSTFVTIDNGGLLYILDTVS